MPVQARVNTNANGNLIVTRVNGRAVLALVMDTERYAITVYVLTFHESRYLAHMQKSSCL